MATAAEFVIVATTTRDAVIPGLRYLGEHGWGDLDVAGLFTTTTAATAHLPQTGPAATSAITVQAAPAIDAQGFYYADDSPSGPWRLTPCCGAAVTYHDSTLCCKSCWSQVDTACDAPADLG